MNSPETIAKKDIMTSDGKSTRTDFLSLVHGEHTFLSFFQIWSWITLNTIIREHMKTTSASLLYSGLSIRNIHIHILF